eukprot:scaffold15134_cov34-Tisochrysis_lutea.AAC.2
MLRSERMAAAIYRVGSAQAILYMDALRSLDLLMSCSRLALILCALAELGNAPFGAVTMPRHALIVLAVGAWDIESAPVCHPKTREITPTHTHTHHESVRPKPPFPVRSARESCPLGFPKSKCKSKAKTS